MVRIMTRKDKDSGRLEIEPERARRESETVRVEYPREGETLAHPSYTFQIGTVPEALRVEVSIDGGEWRPCRESLGLWWYDWEGYASGSHEAVARIEKDKEGILISSRRRFSVQLPS